MLTLPSYTKLSGTDVNELHANLWKGEVAPEEFAGRMVSALEQEPVFLAKYDFTSDAGEPRRISTTFILRDEAGGQMIDVRVDEEHTGLVLTRVFKADTFAERFPKWFGDGMAWFLALAWQ